MKLTLALLLALATPAAAQDAALAAKIAALGRIGSASSPSLSPDGKRFAYLSNASGSPQIWIGDRSGGAARQITKLPDPVQAVAWSPRGDLIAYAVAPGGGLNSQIWVSAPDGSGARRLTPGGKDNNGLGGWTRDGSALRVDSNKDNPAARDPALIDVASGKWQMLAANKGLNTVSDVRGKRATVVRLVGRGDTNVFLIDRGTGREVLLTPHEGKAETDWAEMSPDGRTVYVASDVGRDRAAFGTITLAADGTPSPIRWFATRDDAVADAGVLSDDGRTAALAWNVGGRIEMAFYDTASGKLRPVTGLPVDYGSPFEFSRDGRQLVMQGGAANRTNDVYAIDVATGQATRLTTSAADGVDLAALVRPELVDYAAPDGVKLSGWLYRPANAKGPLPLVFNYHGGPEGQARPTMSPDAQALVASGIAVFAPNVRGSSGYGKAFMAMDDGAKRVGSVSDIKATTDALVAKGIADPARLGIMGGSYGGYMVMAGITEYPKMFAAGANLFGIVNFESFFRETEPWMAAISTTEYGNPVTEAAMLKSLSPIHKLDRITTPLFVLHGANDTNVPVVEAEQIVASLKARGVPVKYTLFPDEGHGWRKTPNRVRSTTEIVGFFVEHLKPAGAATGAGR
ncbi:S9 family peptidase [Glacieibacterium frigidum]|uniref:S9 family peptidase n=1 Tax=Glacieibacterium frigidum TaxID=2593303 RepID=A0A552UHZ6_9SPHN|nr:S9 family peptidase [Glacieibacterium frigidum]TRW17844.1 S9 family peptidase [Glacieibacterium frigidum]